MVCYYTECAGVLNQPTSNDRLPQGLVFTVTAISSTKLCRTTYTAATTYDYAISAWLATLGHTIKFYLIQPAFRV